MIDLKCGDCLELMKEIPDKSIDMILCDLPYGTTCNEWDKRLDIGKLWEQYIRIIKDNRIIALFGAEPYATRIKMKAIHLYKYDFIWIKNTSANFAHAKNMPMRNYENISIFSKGSIGHINLLGEKRMVYNPQGLKICGEMQYHPNNKNFGSITGQRKNNKERFIQEYKGYPQMTLHFKKESDCKNPTQKPVPLLEYLIKTYTNEGDTVLDNCMGSGSTGVACVNLGRSFIGMELNEEHFRIAEERIREAGGDE